MKSEYVFWAILLVLGISLRPSFGHACGLKLVMRDAKNIPRSAHPQTVLIYSASDSTKVETLCNSLERAGHKAVVVNDVHKLSRKRQDKLVVMAEEGQMEEVKHAIPEATVVATKDNIRGSVQALEVELDKRSERQTQKQKKSADPAVAPSL
jgi:hypothetical protein